MSVESCYGGLVKSRERCRLLVQVLEHAHRNYGGDGANCVAAEGSAALCRANSLAGEVLGNIRGAVGSAVLASGITGARPVLIELGDLIQRALSIERELRQNGMAQTCAGRGGGALTGAERCIS